MSFKKLIENAENGVKDTLVNYKIVLIWTFIAMALTHIYFFVGRFINEDMYAYLRKTPAEPGSGRFFYGDAEFTILPVIIFTIIFIELAVSVTLILKMFKIEKPLYGAIVGAFMVTFPSWSYSFGYIFMWDSYSLSLLTVVLAVFITDRYKYGFLPGGFFIACCLSLYQSYIAAAITLIIMLLIIELMEKDFKMVVKKAVAFLALGVFGVILYKLGIWLFDIELSSYKGSDTMGEIPIDMIPGLIKRTYTGFIQFFTGNHFGVSGIRFFYVPAFLAVVYIADIIFGIVMLIGILRKKKIKKLNIIFTALCAAALPLAVNFVDFIGVKTAASTLNTYAFVLMFILPIVLFARYKKLWGGVQNSNKLFFAKRILIVFSVFIIGYNFWMNNAYYQKAEVITENTKNFENRLLGRFEQLEGFTIDTKFAIMADNDYLFGKNVRDHWRNFPYIANDQGNYGFYVTGLRDLNKANYKTRNLMKNLLGVELNTASGEEIEEIKKTDEYKNMGVYPAFDSVKMINGIAVVNFDDRSKDEE